MYVFMLEAVRPVLEYVEPHSKGQDTETQDSAGLSQWSEIGQFLQMVQTLFAQHNRLVKVPAMHNPVTSKSNILPAADLLQLRIAEQAVEEMLERVFLGLDVRQLFRIDIRG